MSTGVDMTVQDQLLAGLRGRFGDSQTAIANAMGISLSRLNNYVRGVRRMDDDAVIACCELLGWSAKRYVALHRAEIAGTKREEAFWRKLAAAIGAVILLVGMTHPARAEARFVVKPEPAAAYTLCEIAKWAWAFTRLAAWSALQRIWRPRHARASALLA